MQTGYSDAVVMVTGASTGLGRAIAHGAAGQGARAVVINFARSADQAEITARLVREAGAAAVLVRGDVGNEADCRRIAAAANAFGRIDALFNNAGVSRAGGFDDLCAGDFLEVYRVNVVGTYQMIRAARSLLEAAEMPAVVNTSSLAGVTGKGSSLAYTASKGALNTLGKALAMTLAPGIRVNTICPGFIDTGWFDRHGPSDARDGLRDHIRQSTALEAVSGADDVADAALFLGSRAARHITGETLIVDAGLRFGRTVL
ncbi:MAG: SDR family oxidoreductase [Novosphingobium sp.]|jgi:3-oxoacyl-[acyl-carrier protein] reductase|nr:SDR family oxidoreductase [Novosphingobium sp.]